MSTEVGGWSKKGEIMSTWLLNAPLPEMLVLCHKIFNHCIMKDKIYINISKHVYVLTIFSSVAEESEISNTIPKKFQFSYLSKIHPC